MENLSTLLFHDSLLLQILAVSGITAILICTVFHFIKKKPEDQSRTHLSPLSFCVLSRYRKKYTKNDWLAVLLIASLYAVVSFTALGSRTFPTTTWQPAHAYQSMVLELTGNTHFNAIYTIYGEGDNNANPDTYQLGNTGMTFEGSDDLVNWNDLAVSEKGSIYEYSIMEGDWNYRYIRITSVSKNDSLTEVGFRSADNTSFLPVQVVQDEEKNSAYPASLIIDEQDKLTLYPTCYDEAYFDEVYHPRNAWEIANGEYMYATVHPLLGTNIMALSIHLFGMNPFAWRLPGAVCGVLILFVLYALLKMLFEKTAYCVIGTILCAADFMHLTTSRIATLEPYSILLILLMFYFMAEYYFTSFYDTPLKKQLRILLCCGISMGLAISAKWTACYSAVGLAVILFTNLFQRLYEYVKAGKYLETERVPESGRNLALRIRETFRKNFWITILCCVIFFLVIPAVIYWLDYLPDHVWRNDTWSIANVWKQNLYMYNYHINLKATHPYQSYWYEWLLDLRPIWYYFGTSADGLKHSISCFSNPLLTWAGLASIVVVTADVITERNRTAWFILIGYITALGPWILFVNRCVFAYHFYPTSMFVILAVTYVCQYLWKSKGGQYFIILFLIVYVLFFYAFLPVTAGFGTDMNTIHALEWLPRWYFG